jgi:hypothetical protein
MGVFFVSTTRTSWFAGRRAALVAGTFLLIGGHVRDTLADTRNASRLARPLQDGPAGAQPARPAPPRDSTPLKVQNIRLEPGPLAESSPSTTLKFDMLNDGASHLTNIVLEVSIVKVRQEESDARQNVLVRPFTIRETVVLQPGYSMEYELRFRNFSPDCGCVPRVNVVSVESLADSKY